ncbi:hypothetical protein GQ53DRAFT_750304 [Thozetella sp. PMI_491]|nr:hypothetical protein GQ53DRAFT_750304 [Thozetella sp. PMI_491]
MPSALGTWAVVADCLSGSQSPISKTSQHSDTTAQPQTELGGCEQAQCPLPSMQRASFQISLASPDWSRFPSVRPDEHHL